MNPVTKSIGKRGVRRLLTGMASAELAGAFYVSADTMADGDFVHLLPDREPERSAAAEALRGIGASETGVALFMSCEGNVAVQPPFPLTVDARAAFLETAPLFEMFDSEPIVGVVLLRLGRYAVGVLRGEELIASKTDTRYVKSRHRAGGSSQRRFERSRERLIRELYDKTCQVAGDVFEPFLREIDYVAIGGERGTLDGFVKRCRLMQYLKPRTLSRLLSVDRPNQRALESISYEVWKSRVTFF